MKAKTVYPERPGEWPEEEPWPSDPAWALVKAGLMLGKSIGFVTLSSHVPSDEEIRKRPDLATVRRVVDRWLLVEYCCCWMPTNPQAVVEEVAKADLRPLDLKAFGIEPRPNADPAKQQPAPPVIPHTNLDEVAKAVSQTLASIDLEREARRAVEEGYDRTRGRV